MASAAGAPQRAHAHEVRPGYLELSAGEADAWDVLWKVPAKGGRRLALYVQLPDGCEETPPVARSVGGAHVERWRATCAGGLLGRPIRIEGLAATRTDVLVRIEHRDGRIQTLRLTPSDPAFQLERAPSSLQVATTYLELGVEHILLGIDHLLFVLALLFLVGSWRQLVGTVTTFTAAHSLTLAAATLGFVHVPQAPVEAAIALSIVFVTVEVVHRATGRPALAARKPWVVAFAFGLLHGFGFASALRAVGLPDHAIPAALAFFNVGVEVGQLLFVAAVFAFFKALHWLGAGIAANTWAATAQLARPAAYAIGIPAAFWLIQRTAAFWS
ncbi:MAG TPA: HupE/UreJ family protein [Myxococcota bacterium]